jgi:hypothetical protein
MNLIGDYNNDDVVNAADYTVWRNNLGVAGYALGANRDPANGSCPVSVADFNSWKTHFGMSGGAGRGGLAGNSSVPEPTCYLLAGLAMMGVMCLRRRS